MIWQTWKKGFDLWENKTAEVMEQWLKNPVVLQPVGSLLSATMKMKAASDRAVASWWANMGLPTRRDQERTLHALNQLQSKLSDLEERLVALDEKKA